MKLLTELAESSSVLSIDDLGDQIVAAAGRIASATCRWLLLVAEFDRRDGCAQYGLASTAQWLGWACGLSHRTAVEHVRVARGLVDHPRLADEMTAGRLSFSHVRAITRVAEPGKDEMVEGLVMAAQHGTVRHVESLVQGLRIANAPDGEGDRAPEDYVRQGWNSSGQWQMSARLEPESGAMVATALAAVARADELSPAEALARMAEIALAAINDSAKPPRLLRGEERAAIIVHVDESSLAVDETPAAADDAPRSRERAAGRIAGGPGLPRPVIERLLCSGRIRTAVVAKDTTGRCNVLDLGRSHRIVSERQFKALLLRDGGCGHPGCRSRHGLEAHHVKQWIRGGRTDLANLVLLCRRHHHSLHDREFTIVPLGLGRFDFRRADGRPLPDHVDGSQLIAIAPSVDELRGQVAVDAARTRWDGQRLDRHYAVSVLAS